MVQDEPGKDDMVYEAWGIRFLIDKQEYREMPYIEIDYGQWGTDEDFIITSGF